MRASLSRARFQHTDWTALIQSALLLLLLPRTLMSLLLLLERAQKAASPHPKDTAAF
jgi:hypothetical protein